MKAGKPRDQSFAVAYAVKRKNTKKMAKGGPIEQAGSERPTADSGETHACTYMCNNDKHYNDKGELVRAGSERPTADSHEEGVEHASSPADAGVEIVRGGSDPTSRNEFNSSVPSHDSGKSIRAGSTRPTADEDEYGETEMLAEGGVLRAGSERPTADSHMTSMADMIAERLHRKLMAEGGMAHDDGLDENNKEHGNEEDDLSFDALGEHQFDDEQLSPQPEDSNEDGDEREHESEDKEDSSMISKISKRNKNKKV